MATKSLKASCLCQSINHEVSNPTPSLPLKLQLCHCTSCRKCLGTSLTVAVLPSSYRPPPDILTRSTAYDFSQRITAYFCSICGTHIFFHMKQSVGWPFNTEEYWAVHTGTLEEASDDVLEADVHWFVGDTLDGGFADFLPTVVGREKRLPRYAGFKEKSEILPLHWKSSEIPAQITTSTSDKLYCHCQCGGVKFWIARPSGRSKETSDQSARWLDDNGGKYLANLCSCNTCRLDTGMEWVGWACVPTIDISLDVEGKIRFSVPFGMLKGYRSRDDVLRWHCGVCGASAFYQKNVGSDLVKVAVGLMDAPEGARAESWLQWTAELSGREDALLRAKELTRGVEYGLKEYVKRKGEVS